MQDGLDLVVPIPTNTQEREARPARQEEEKKQARGSGHSITVKASFIFHQYE